MVESYKVKKQHPQAVKIGNSILKDCEPVSESYFGYFVPSEKKQQVAMLRGQDTLELYRASDKLEMITKYQMPNSKATDFNVLRCPYFNQDLIILHLPDLKFIVLIFDEETSEFAPFLIFNFEHLDELKNTGKKFPLKGMLRTLSTHWFSGFGFIADDTTFVWCQLQESIVQPLSLQKQQSSSIGAPKPKLNENYLYCMSAQSDSNLMVEQLVKPMNHTDLRKYGIQVIVDIQMVEQEASQQVLLLVLYRTNVDKMVGTKARYPLSKLSVFEIGYGSGDGASDLKLLLTIDALSYYSRRIIPALASNDYCYIVTPFSLYLIRLEKNRLAEIQTSSAAVAIAENFSTDPQKQLYLDPDTDNKTERSVLNYCSTNLKLDGPTRFSPLTGDRLLICSQHGEFIVLQVRFDQADLDVAEASFIRIPAESKCVPSSLSVISYGNSFLMFVTSYYQDCLLLELPQPEESVEQEPLEKRQRVGSSSGASELLRRKKLMQPSYKTIKLLDSLAVVAPITQCIQVPDIAAGSTDTTNYKPYYSNDFIVSSGNQVKSYLTFLSESVPLIENNLPLKHLESFKLTKVQTTSKFVFLNYDQNTAVLEVTAKAFQPFKEEAFKTDEPTIAAFDVKNARMTVQITPSVISLVGQDSKVVQSVQNEGRVVAATEYLKPSDLFFVLTDENKLQCYSGGFLKRKFETSLAIIDNVTAVSAYVEDTTEYLVVATTYQGRNVMESRTCKIMIYKVDELSDQLQLIYTCSGVTEQLAFLPNMIFQNHSKLTSRAITDCALDFIDSQEFLKSGDALIQEENQNLTVVETKLFKLGGKTVLTIILSNGKIMVYEDCVYFKEKASEKFRFKLVTSPVLIKEPLEQQLEIGSNLIVADTNLLIVLHPSRAFTITTRKDKLLFHNLGSSLGPALLSLAPFKLGYLVIDSLKQNLKIAKMPSQFDIRKMPKLSDGYLMHQITFANKGIKSMKIFKPTGEDKEYLFVSTFVLKQGQGSAEYKSSIELGFTAATKAPTYSYQLEVYLMPKPGVWKEYSVNFDPSRAIIERFQDNQVINCLEQVVLKPGDGKEMKNYMVVASIKLDTANQGRRVEEEGFYSSALNIYQVISDQRKLKTCLVNNYKRSITCISSFNGKLLTTMRYEKLTDLILKLYTFNEQKSELLSPQPFPDGVQNLATSISFDGDYVIMGDAYKNLTILKKAGEEENKKEKVTADLINIKKVMSNKINAYVIGAFSLNRNLSISYSDQCKLPFNYSPDLPGTADQVIRLTEVEKKLFSVATASQDGYVRVYQVKENQKLEIASQINLMDKILDFYPLQLSNQFKTGQEDLEYRDRHFVVVTQRSGVMIVTPCPEKEQIAYQAMIPLLSKHFPHKGCHTPLQSHFTPQYKPVPERNTLTERVNSKSVNLNCSLGLYYFLSDAQQRALAAKASYSKAKLIKFACVNSGNNLKLKK